MCGFKKRKNKTNNKKKKEKMKKKERKGKKKRKEKLFKSFLLADSGQFMGDRSV